MCHLIDAKIMKFSRHGPGLDLTNGGIILDGPSFQGKPENGISIAVWLKLSDIHADHVIFRSISSGERLSKTTYLLKIQNGRLQWSHQNDNAKSVFMVISPPVIGPNIWFHVVVTYDGFSEKAKVLVNGKIVAVGRGHGKLSGQWGDLSYFGSNSKTKPFNGYLDEIYIFKRPLQNSEVRQYLTNMDSRNYALYNISNFSLDRKEKDFPSVVSGERLKGIPEPAGKLIKINVSDHTKNSSANVNIKTKSVETHTNTSKENIEAKEAAGNHSQVHDSNFKGLFSELKAAASKSMADFSCAVNGTVYEKMTFSGGLLSGKFFKVADISNMTSCISQCCKKITCDAALMKGKTCFSLTCRSRKLCELRPAKLSTFDLKIAFVKRMPRKAMSQLDQNAVDQSSEKVFSHSNKCAPGIRVANVTINAGVGAGQVVQYRNISKIDACIAQCCSMPKCTTAFLVQGTCYAIACVVKDFCKVRPPPSEGFLSEVVYVNRSGDILFNDPQNALVLHAKSVAKLEQNTTLTSGKHKEKVKGVNQNEKVGTKKPNRVQKGKFLQNSTRTHSSELECRVETIMTDVRLAGDLNAGEFVDHGIVRGIKTCILKCCSDPLCNVTYMIGKKCFAVRCHSAELCKTVPHLEQTLSPTVAFLRREKLKSKFLKFLISVMYFCWIKTGSKLIHLVIFKDRLHERWMALSNG